MSRSHGLVAWIFLSAALPPPPAPAQATWTRRGPEPAVFGAPVAAYDPVRGRVVLVAASALVENRLELFEWDGVAWHRRDFTGGPQFQSFALAFDEARARLVLWGGVDFSGGLRAETWEWDGTSWTQRTVAAQPSPRVGQAMVYDRARGRTVLFGGMFFSFPNFTHYQDTWEWDGSAWTQAATTGPSPRNGSGLVFDPGRGRSLLFGGANLSTVFADTWEWDGVTWSQRQPAASPTSRSGFAMAFDSARNRAVVWGGVTPGTNVYLSDTWTWDGTTWSQQAPPAAPSPRVAAAFADDRRRGRTVLFGGAFYLGGYGDDTWEWDGTDWRENSATRPTGLYLPVAAAFDAARGRTVMLVAETNQTPGLWEWDGMHWRQRVATPQPGRRSGTAMVYQTRRGRTLLFGGSFRSSPVADTWEYSVPCDSVGPGHPTGGASLQYLTQPVVGTSFCLDFPSATGTGFLALDAGRCRAAQSVPPPVFCTTASLYLAPAVVLFASGSPARPCLSIPQDLALVGTPACLQAMALQATSCLRATDAVVATIQGQ